VIPTAGSDSAVGSNKAGSQQVANGDFARGIDIEVKGCTIGILVDKFMTAKNISGVGTNLFIGADSIYQEALDGNVDDVRIYNKSLTQQDITDLYNGNNNSGLYNNLKGWWPIDEATGTTTADFSGNTNTGTLINGQFNSPAADGTTNGPIWVAGGGKTDATSQTQFKTIAPIAASGTDSNYYLYYGNVNEKGSAQSYSSYGLKFDGSNDYVSVGNKASLTFGNGTTDSAFSLSAWVKYTGTICPVISKYSGPGYDYRLTIVGNDLYINTSDTSATAYVGRMASVAIPTNSWVHLVGTYNGNGATSGFVLYANGVRVDDTNYSSGSYVAMEGTNANFDIGREQGGTYNCTGSIDDARVYNRVLSSTEVSALYSNAPAVSNTGLVGWWKLDEGSGATTADSSGNANTGTLTNFNLNQNSNWITNTSLLHATTEPTQTMVVTETESPTFFQWRQAGGSWSARTQLSATETQLGSEGVYLTFSPAGSYSRNDYYKVASWAVEPFSSTRGKNRTFPSKANIVADGSAVDIIDATNNKLWMRITAATNNLLGANAPNHVTALNGHMYVTSTDGLTDISLMDDTGTRYTSSGTAAYASSIANRGAASTYGSAAGTALASTTANDVSVNVLTTGSIPSQYVTVATASGLSAISNATGTTAALTYSKASGNAYSHTALASDGKLYGSNTTTAELDRYDSIQSDGSSQTTSSDLTYSTSTTPALRSNTINSIRVTQGTSLADNVSNEVALATSLGTDLIDEHTTQSSALIRHYTRETTGTSKWTNKQYGAALDFDGTNDTVSFGNYSSLNFGSGNFTISAWFKTNASSRVNLLEKFDYNPGVTETGYYLDMLANGKIRASIETKNGSQSYYVVDSSATVNDNAWHQVTLVRTGASLTDLYIDGSLSDGTVQTVGTVASTDSTAPFLVSGTISGFSGNWQGTIDEVRTYGRALSSSEVSTLAQAPDTVSSTNLVGLWHFNERSGQTIFDDTSNANNGTLGANSTAASDDPTRVIPAIAGTTDSVTAVGISKGTDQGQALLLDGVNDFANTGNAAGLFTAQGTISAWVKTNSDTAQTIFSTNNGFGIVIGNGSTGFLNNELIIVFGSNGNRIGYTTATRTELIDNKWHHVVVSGNGSVYTIWLDGVSKTVTIGQNGGYGWTSMGGSSASDIGWLGFSGLGYFMNGSVDDLRVYNRVLSGEEINVLYDAGQGRIDNPSSGLVGWWKLNEGSGQTVTDSSSTAG